MLLTGQAYAHETPPGVFEEEWLEAFIEHQANPPHVHLQFRGLGGVEQWRALVSAYFQPDEIDTAMRVMNCETGGTGNPDSYNQSSGASGLFQHLPKYWSERSAKAGWSGADIFDPEANVAVAAWLQRTGGWTHWTCY